MVLMGGFEPPLDGISTRCLCQLGYMSMVRAEGFADVSVSERQRGTPDACDGRGTHLH